LGLLGFCVEDWLFLLSFCVMIYLALDFAP